jgi:hypothetical protein
MKTKAVSNTQVRRKSKDGHPVTKKPVDSSNDRVIGSNSRSTTKPAGTAPSNPANMAWVLGKTYDIGTVETIQL